MKEIRLDLFKLHDENDRGKSRIKAEIDGEFYREVLRGIRLRIGIRNRDIVKRLGMSYFDFMKNLNTNKLPIKPLEKLIRLYSIANGITEDDAKDIFYDKIKKLVCNSGNAFVSTNFVRCLSDDFCRIAGSVVTDGSLHLGKNKVGASYLIAVADYYQSNLEVFCKWLQNVFGINVSCRHNKYKNYFETRFKNKIVFRYLNRILNIPAGEKSKIVSMPEIIKNSNPSFRKSFTSGALIFDGGVIFKSGYYQFASQSISLMGDVENTLTEFGITPDHHENVPDNKSVYRLVIRDKDKLKILLRYFIPLDSSKYMQLKLHLEGLPRIASLDELTDMLDRIYPRFGRSLSFSDIISIVSDGKQFKTDDLVKRLGKSRDVVKKALNKLEGWEVLISNNGKGKVNKVWSLSPNLKMKEVNENSQERYDRKDYGSNEISYKN